MDSSALFNPHLTDGVKRLQAASQMIKTAAGFLRETLPGSAGGLQVSCSSSDLTEERNEVLLS